MRNHYFVGIDVAKLRNVATVRDLRSVRDSFSFANTQEGFSELLARVSEPDAVYCLESTGFYHLPLAFYLRDQGCKVKLLNPLLTKKMAKAQIRKAKTDTIDAGHLAWLAQFDAGHWFEESRLTCELKIICRHRVFLTRNIERLKKHDQSVRFRSTLFEEGTSHLREVEESCTAIIAALESEVHDLDRLLRTIARSIPEVAYLDAIPGVSPVLACEILAEIGDIRRFPNPKALVAFAGIDPTVAQSGTSLHVTGKMSKRGSPYLRYYLYHVARVAIQFDPELKDYYLRKKAEQKTLLRAPHGGVAKDPGANLLRSQRAETLRRTGSYPHDITSLREECDRQTRGDADPMAVEPAGEMEQYRAVTSFTRRQNSVAGCEKIAYARDRESACNFFEFPRDALKRR